ncbi:MAG: TVP38/TMEM64 family protein [Phycisphaerales bacterium]
MRDDEQPSDPAAEVRFRDFGRAGPLAIFAALAPAAGGFLLLGFMPRVAGWLDGLGPAGIAVYIAAFAVTSGLAILPTYAQAALGGFAFGLAGGVPAALAGFLGGSVIGYAAARRTAGDDANRVIDRHPKWRAVRDAFVARTENPERAGFWRTLGIVTLIRFPPNSPFALTNLVMASVRVPRLVFAIGTLVGMLPRTALVVWIGSQIAGELSRDALSQARPGWVLPAGIAAAVLVLILLAWLGDKAIKKAVASGELPAESRDPDAAEQGQA